MKETAEDYPRRASSLKNQAGNPSAAKKRRRAKRKTPSWTEQLADAIVATEDKLPPSLQIPDPPDWVMNIWSELAAVFYPAAKLKRGAKFDAASLGALLGRHLAIARLLQGEVPLGPKVEAELARAARQKPVFKLDGRVVKLEERRCAHLIKSAQELSKEGANLALEQPHGELVKYTSAFNKAADLKPDEFASDYTLTHRMRIYIALLCLRPVMHHFKSIGEIYRALRDKIGENRLGDFKSFEKACQKIGVRLRGRGRPAARH